MSEAGIEVKEDKGVELIFTIEYTRVKDGYIGKFTQLPEVIAIGETIDEVDGKLFGELGGDSTTLSNIVSNSMISKSFKIAVTFNDSKFELKTT